MKLLIRVAAMVLSLVGAHASRADAQWTTVPYDAANFSGSGGMTWTVDAGDQITYSYLLDGDHMRVAWFIDNSSTSGGNTWLKLKIPGGRVAARYMDAIVYLGYNGSDQIGVAGVGSDALPDGEWIYIRPQPCCFGSAGSIRTSGQVSFDVQTSVWQQVAYDAANFSGSGSMTWTVDAGDQMTYSYFLSGNHMRVAWYIDDSVTSGGDTWLKLRI